MTSEELHQDAPWPGVLFTSDFRKKTLVLTGFHNIDVIDLDTIETSNLNRQFLFRRAHVSQSKAQVAADVVKSFAPNANIKAYQANIKEARFGLDFFKGFDLVLNGLDNMDARRHVNRLCVAAGVPLVESGTAGYVGQVSVHVKGVTECYECQPRVAAQKSYPICTLRNTPDKPIHCVVWGKELLFPRLFGKVEVSDLDEGAAAPTSTVALEAAVNGAAESGDAEHAAQKAAAAAEAAAAEAAEAASFFKLRDSEQPLDYAVRIFERLYNTDIQKVCSMEELWKTRTRPSALTLPELLPDVQSAVTVAADSPTPAASRALDLKDQTTWSNADNARVFLTAIVKFLTQRKQDLGTAVFDKDDDLAVDFVTAASNLRAACYGIPQQSLFDAKGMAGNIIHAIATTNAIVGGLIVVEALKLLAGCSKQCITSFLRVVPGTIGNKRTGRMQALISGENPSSPNPSCMVCGKAQMHLTANTQTMTLQTLVYKVLKQRLAINLPSLNTEGGFFYEEGDDLDEDEAEASRKLLPRTLAALPGGGLMHGSILAVGDQSQAINLDLIFSHQGGGPVLVPVYLALGHFAHYTAVALSNSTILAGSCANVLCNARKRHPFKNKPMVDWDLILLMEPPTLLGAIAGSYINKLLPVWISHILLAVLLTLMTIRVVQRACRIYHRESAAHAQAAQTSSSGPPTAAAAQAAQAAAHVSGISADPATNSSLPCMPDGPSCGLCRDSITSGSECSLQGRLAAANPVVQLSAVSASGAAVVTSSSAMISSATMSRRLSRPLLSAAQQQHRSTAAAGETHQAEQRPASAPLSAPAAAQAIRLPSSTLIPLEIEGNISEEALVELVSGQASPLHWLTPPPLAAAVVSGDGCGEILLQGGDVRPRLHSSNASSGNGTLLQQQQQPAHEFDEVPPPCPAECKLLYAPPQHTRRDSWEFSDWGNEEADPPAGPPAIHAVGGTTHQPTPGRCHLVPAAAAGCNGAGTGSMLPSRFAAAAEQAGVAAFPTGSTAEAKCINDVASGSSCRPPSLPGVQDSSGGDPMRHLLAAKQQLSALTGGHEGLKGKGKRTGQRTSQRPPEVASAAAAVAVEAVLKAEAAQLPLVPILSLVALFAAVLLTSLFSKSAGCGSAGYWAIQWAVAPVLLAVWWYSRRRIVRKTALKRDAQVDFHGEVRWTSSNSIVFPAICTLAGVIAGMFGLGGAVVKTPLMLELGVHPQVTAATTQTMLLLTSAASTIVYAQLGDIPWDYAAVLLPLAFLVTLAGQFAIDWLVQKVGRSSLIVLVLAGFFIVACGLTYYITAQSVAQVVQHPQGAGAVGKADYCPAGEGLTSSRAWSNGPFAL
eukprot:gene1221-1560_t